MKRILAIILLVLVTRSALAEPVTLDKPIYVEAFVRSTTGGRDEKVAGNLLRYDDEMLVIRSARADGIERELRWLDLTPGSAFVVKSRLIDKTKARDWLELGRFAWSVNAKDQARSALASAVKLDPNLKQDAADILATDPGTAVRKASADTAPSTAPTASTENDEGLPDVTSSPGASPQSRDPVQKYQKSTPEQDAKALANARRRAEKVGSQMGIKFAEITTDHFILFTDWDPREYGFLKENLEGAYAAVSQQFEIPVKENVFVGKLAVFMFAKHDDFMKFASTIDGFEAKPSVLGYYQSRFDGLGHMAMWKPDIQSAGGNRHAAEIRWAYVLTHEFTHAFVARYRSNQFIPRWLNEGVAEVIANKKFPKPTARSFARTMASKTAPDVLMDLFNDGKMPSGEMYPVMMTMVETLLVRDRKAFLAYFDDLKAGMNPEEALKLHYKLDNPSFIAAWKSYVMSGKY